MKNVQIILSVFLSLSPLALARLTDNALIFNKDKMKAWWQQGYDYAKNKSELMSDNLQ